MSARRELKSIGEVSNTLYRGLPKLSVVIQAVFVCSVDSGLGKNVGIRPSWSLVHSVSVNSLSLRLNALSSKTANGVRKFLEQVTIVHGGLVEERGIVGEKKRSGKRIHGLGIGINLNLKAGKFWKEGGRD